MGDKKILVVGGAGYIGSHMNCYLKEKGCQVTVLDNLSNGHREAVSVSGCEFVHGDMCNIPLLHDLFSRRSFDAVMHFASSILVGESVQHPSLYYRNNITNTLNLLDTMLHHGIRKFIFSSTAAVFGSPVYTPIDEAHPTQPINPYGYSKLVIERILRDYDAAYQLRSVSLRYFNAAGAHPEGLLGECHEPETHLIPLILQVASGARDAISVFGSDYDTPDGTCIRDYIHITDLCQAHWLALQQLFSGRGSAQYNLGNGAGYSVRQIIDVVAGVTGRKIPVKLAARRAGDPARLVANAEKARTELGWKPAFNDLETIVSHAWQWERNKRK